MLMRVDLPAPFSPTMPVIEPRLTTSETFRLAWTSPKRFSIWRNSIAGGASPVGLASVACPSAAIMAGVKEVGGAPRAPQARRPPPLILPSVFALVVGHVVRNRDLAGDDVCLRLVDLGLHVRGDELLVVLVIGPVDPALLEAQDRDPALPGVVLGRGKGVVSGEIDALDHGGQHGAGVEIVLVGIDPDRELLGVGRRLINAEPGVARRGIDDVDAAVELGLGELAAAARIVPSGRRRAGHVLDHLDLRIDVLGALLIAAFE